MKSTRGQGFKGLLQRGFTLVELAIVLVIAGIILVGVLKGTDAINKAKVERAVADLKGLQATILEYQKRNNRLPGDCNLDGIIALNPPIQPTILNTAASGTGVVPNSVVRDATRLGVCGITTNVQDFSNNDQPATETPTTVTSASGVGVSVATVGADSATTGSVTKAYAVANLVYNELRRAGIVDGNRTNLELSKHLQQDIFLVGAMQDATNNERANVIVMYGVPVWLAEGIDAEIDGVAQDYSSSGLGGPATTGRVRLWSDSTSSSSTNNMTAPNYSAGSAKLSAVPTASPSGQYGTDRDALVAISFQFDTMKLSR